MTTLQPVRNNNDPDINQEEVLLFFKTCVIREEKQFEQLQEILGKTIPIRDSILMQANVNLIEAFPFFFVDQNLVWQSILRNITSKQFLFFIN